MNWQLNDKENENNIPLTNGVNEPKHVLLFIFLYCSYKVDFANK